MSSSICSDSGRPGRLCGIHGQVYCQDGLQEKPLGSPKHIQLPAFYGWQSNFLEMVNLKLSFFLHRSIQLQYSYVEYCCFSDVPIRRIEELKKHMEIWTLGAFLLFFL